jgi:heme A synthase
VVAGFVVLALNAAAAAWGGFAWWRSDPSVGFWYVLRAAQAAVVVQSVLGGVLVASGEDAPDGLHLFYGLAPLFIAFVSEGMRVGAAQAEVAGVEDVEGLERREQVLLARRVVLREMGVMTIGTLMIVTLSLRAAGIF